MALILSGLVFGGLLYLIGISMEHLENRARARRQRDRIEALRRQGRWPD